MMQLARELKTLAKEFSIAVVVSVAAPCPLRAGVCRGEEPWRGFGALGRGGPSSRLRRSKEACIPQCSAP